MSMYQDYTITFNFTSSLGSKLQSDTIFGHICWAIRYLMGEDKLMAFLKLYGEDLKPPILVSNGFPAGYLPKPIMPPVTQEEIQAIVNENKDERVLASHKITTIKKLKNVPKEILLQFKHTPITPSALFAALYKNEIFESIMNWNKGQVIAFVQHNTIDRILGSVRRGGLYNREETFFDPASAMFEVYLKTNYFSKTEIMGIFSLISLEGFGRDSSTGKGHFDFQINDGIDLPEAEETNAFMTLSSYIPTSNDPVDGYYDIVHKYGKLGGLYAKGVSEVFGNPFKVPLIMFSAGSTFFNVQYHQDKIYGGLIEGVHKNEEIKHYAYAFPMGMKIEVRNEYI